MHSLPSRLLALAALAVALALPLASRAGHGDDEGEGGDARLAPPPAASPQLALYRAECGACHLAYPPGLLPARSWERLLAGLERHFGQDAALDDATREALARWLVDNAAEAGTHRKSRRALRASAGHTPLRLSELAFLRREHDEEVAPEVWQRPAVGSRANCPACHPDAEGWRFDEERVRIPR